jgi:PAS domain S-box-containing protein
MLAARSVPATGGGYRSIEDADHASKRAGNRSVVTIDRFGRSGASVDSTASVLVSRILADLAGLSVNAEDFLAGVLGAVAQPVWVVDHEGVIRFANPAAIAALGYEREEELFGLPSHETIHYQRPDGTPFPAAACPMLLPRTTGETVASDLDWFSRRDGSMFPVSYISVPLEMRDGRGAVVAFTDIEDRIAAERVLREHDAALQAQQASLRRVATLVAAGAASSDVFAAVAEEVGQVTGLPLIAIWRYEPDATATVIGEWSDRPHPFQAGTHWPLDGPTICFQVRATGRPAKIDDFADIPGTVGEAARETGIHACAGAPIVVDGEVWGAMSADSTDGAPLPDDIEDRLAEFTELVATAIANAASREELARLADEQAALRRVATLVAQGVPPSELFGAVTEEVGTLLGADFAGMIRYEPDRTVTPVAVWPALGEHPDVPDRWPLVKGDPATLIAKTRGPARIDDWDDIPGPLAAFVRDELGIRSSVGSPILVEGRLWGALAVHSIQAGPLPAGTASRLLNFTELVATAISNAQARSDLAASRARIVAATDDERRRVVRDLHDGAQQRLVHSIVTLKLAHQALEPNEQPASELVGEALEHVQRAKVELRELAHGILPTVLTRGGLRAAVESLASRTPVPVEINVAPDRLPAPVEATAYFVVAEALTNVAKHAHATAATVQAQLEEDKLQLQVRDDGAGGARPDGSGLVGLADRLAALDGELRVHSPVDGGTLIAAEIPLLG